MKEIAGRVGKRQAGEGLELGALLKAAAAEGARRFLEGVEEVRSAKDMPEEAPQPRPSRGNGRKAKTAAR